MLLFFDRGLNVVPGAIDVCVVIGVQGQKNGEGWRYVVVNRVPLEWVGVVAPLELAQLVTDETSRVEREKEKYKGSGSLFEATFLWLRLVGSSVVL